MLFKKKKRMIDIGKLHERGVVKLPKEEISIPTTTEGFVDLNSQHTSPSLPASSSSQENTGLFGLASLGETQSTPASTDSFTTAVNGYNKREIDAKMQELDNKIYKLEQRIELLERKAGVNESNPASPW